MTSLDGLDCGVGFVGIPPSAIAAFGSIAMDGDEYVRCSRCSYGGCDVRVAGCGCVAHARCLPLQSTGALSMCPQCSRSTAGLVLFPMSFREIDEARKTVAALAGTQRVGRKRKSTSGGEALDDKLTNASERRTGRWSMEETSYCDKLIAKFESGELPVVNGIKLNEFLGNMLKSKQSRLTKKMKNAKLSSRTFLKTSGYIADTNEAREFSELEESFFLAVQCPQERAEIKFHMQREWREHFSQYCVSIGQPLDADAWLSSVEEMDRRASEAKDAARMKRRKLMMGFALKTDTRNIEHGVFIEKTEAESRVAEAVPDAFGGSAVTKDTEELLARIAEESANADATVDLNGRSSLLHSAPFLSKTIAHIQRHSIPFEHVDVWVPSFVSGEGGDPNATTCRLCYAGSATVERKVAEDGQSSEPLTAEEQFNLFAFGDYSQKFSFDVGCGLPGRVYESGRPTWEQSVHNAPHHHFERCGGALQWGIKTVLGIPIASPNVGRIVLTLYSRYDRPKDQDLVARLSDEFTKLMPSPKWKLVVDIGETPETVVAEAAAAATSASASASASNGVSSSGTAERDSSVRVHASASVPAGPKGRDTRIDQVVSLLGEVMPSDPSSNLAPYLPGFMSLRLLLLRPSRTAHEDEIAQTMLDSYSSYAAGGRTRGDIAVMLARDYMFLSQQRNQQTPQQQQQHQQSPPFLGIGQSMMSSASSSVGLSLFGLSSASAAGSIQNSPALAPIPVSANGDSLSIVSN